MTSLARRGRQLPLQSRSTPLTALPGVERPAKFSHPVIEGRTLALELLAKLVEPDDSAPLPFRCRARPKASSK